LNYILEVIKSQNLLQFLLTKVKNSRQHQGSQKPVTRLFEEEKLLMSATEPLLVKTMLSELE
jgi:hypothetical protein